MTIMLKALLVERHLQSHSAFVREYDKAAAAVDPAFVGQAPGRAQFYRWLSGGVSTLPYAHHCRVLENMFPGWSVADLFAPERDTPFRPIVASPTGIRAVYPTRAAFAHAMTPDMLFDGARHIRIAGLSLNLLSQQYSHAALQQLVEAGTTVQCMFLDPDGEHLHLREAEEGHEPGHLETLTRLNIAAIQRVRTRLTPGAPGELAIRVYDATIRFNITLIDDRLAVVQLYLSDARGIESPTLVLDAAANGLLGTFDREWEFLWARAKQV